MQRFQCSERGIKIEVAGGVSGVGGLLCRGRIAPLAKLSSRSSRGRAARALHAH